MDKEESTVEIQQRKIEQRRFILWSIARANAPVPRGPHFEGFRPEVVAPNVTTTPVQSVEVRRATLAKRPPLLSRLANLLSHNDRRQLRRTNWTERRPGVLFVDE